VLTYYDDPKAAFPSFAYNWMATTGKCLQLIYSCYLQRQQSFCGPLSRTARVSWYQKKHSPTHHPDHQPNFITFFHLPRSIASSLFKLHAWQSFAQPLSTSFLVCLLVWSPPPHIPYISSPEQCLLFTTLFSAENSQ